jgi:hypothetical protein
MSENPARLLLLGNVPQTMSYELALLPAMKRGAELGLGVLMEVHGFHTDWYLSDDIPDGEVRAYVMTSGLSERHDKWIPTQPKEPSDD